MTITQYDLDNYIATLRNVNQTAADKIIAYINKYGLSDTKQLLDYSYSIVATYAEAAGAWAAEMYDAIALLEGKYLPPAEIADIATYGDVAKAINGTLKVSENAEEIASAATRWVKMASADTMLNNAIRDGAQFAWVPHGDTCPFCITLASRGWQNASKKALKGGHAEHIHSNCDCQYTIRFDENTNVEGYDPDKYLSMYRNAEGSTPQERINSMRREQNIIKLASQTNIYTAIPESLAGNFDDFSPLSISNDDIGILKELANLSTDKNYEYGEILYPGGHTEPFTSEKYDKVAIPLDTVDGNGLRLYHSHTNITPLSSDDFGFLCNERVDEIACIANNKDVFVARIGDGWRPTEEEYLETLTQIRTEVDSDILLNPEGYGLNYDSSPQERNYVGIREQAYRIARAFGWQLEAGNVS